MNHFKYILYTLLLLLPIWGCQLDDSPTIDPTNLPPSIDFRTPYCGDFAFTSYHWTFIMGNQYYRDTVNFVGTIAVLEGTDSSLSIRYRAGTITYNCGAPWLTVITPKLNAGGILQYPSFLTCSNHASFEGGFDRKDTLDVKIGDGGLGSQGGHIIRGVRIL